MAGGTGSGWELPGAANNNTAAPTGAGTGTGWEVPGESVAPAKSGGGFLGSLAHDVGSLAHWTGSKLEMAGSDLKAIPGGLYDMGKTEAEQIAQTVRHPIVSGTNDPNYVGNVPSGKHADALVH